MTTVDPPPYRDNGDGTGVGPDRGSTTGTPRWVKMFGIIALIVVVLFVILMFTRGLGGHGPGDHTSSPGGQTPSSSVTDGRIPPEGGH